jgi:hypothetical protein
MSSLLKAGILSFLLKNSRLLKENYENGYKIMCLNADDWKLGVKNFQEFLKKSRYWGIFMTAIPFCYYDIMLIFIYFRLTPLEIAALFI